MTAPVLELHIKASGVQDVENLTRALTQLDTAAGNLARARNSLSALDQMSAHLKELRAEMKQGFDNIARVMQDGMKNAFSAANAAAAQGGATMAKNFKEELQKISTTITTEKEEVLRKLTAANGATAAAAGAAGKKVGKEFADGVQSEVGKVRISMSVPLAGGARAALSANGMDNLNALQAETSKIKASMPALIAAYEAANAALEKQVAKIMKAATQSANTMRGEGYIAWWDRVVSDMEKGELALKAEYAKTIATLDKQVAAVMKAATNGPNTMRGSGYINWWDKVIDGMEAGEAKLRAEYAKSIVSLETQVAKIMKAATQGPNTMRGEGYISWWDKVITDMEKGEAKLKIKLALEATSMEQAVALYRNRIDDAFSRRVQGGVGQAMSDLQGPYSSISSGSYGALRQGPKTSDTSTPKNLDDTAKNASKAASAMSVLKAEMNDAHSAARGLASGFGAMWLTWGNIAPLLAGAAISHSFMQVIKLGAEVQNTFEVIRVLSEESIGSVAGLNSQMLELARTGPYGPREIAEAMKTLSLAGLSAAEVTSSIRDVLNFATAGTTSVQQAADVLTSVGASFKISASDYNYIGDVISKAAAVSKSSVESMGNAFKSASTVNTLYGVSLKDVGINLALLANTGIQNSAAGTALTNMYIDLAGRTPKATKALKDLGVTALDPLTGKMRDLGGIYRDFLVQLSKKPATDQLSFVNDIFAQRSRKDVVAILDSMRTAAKEGGAGVVTEFDRISAEMANSAGFQATAAAVLMLTPLNQMKSVFATMQATFVESFTALEPAIQSVSGKLKDMFNSEGFRNGLERLVLGVASLTELLVTHAGTITMLLAVYVGFKVFTTVAALFTGLAEATAAYTLAAGAAVTRATAMTVAVEGSAVAANAATTATARLAVANEANALAQAGAAGAGLRMGSAVSGLLAGASKLVPWLTALWMGYELYSFWAGKAAEKSADLSGATFEATMKALKAETERLRELNAAKREGITLDELRSRSAISSAIADANTPVQLAQRRLMEAEDRLNSGPAGLPGRNGDLARAEQVKRVASAQDALNRAKVEAATKVNQLEAQGAALKKEAAEQAARIEQEAIDRNNRIAAGNEARTKTGKKVREPGLNSLPYDNDRSTLLQQASSELSALKATYTAERQVLDDNHRLKLVSEGQYQAQLLALTERNTAETEALVQAKRVALAEEFADNDMKARADVKNSRQAAIIQNLENRWISDDMRLEGQLKSVRAETSAAREKASNAELGEIIKLKAANEEYWLKADIGIKKEADLARVKQEAAGLSDTARARLEAEIKVEDAHIGKMSELQREYDSSEKALIGFLSSQEDFDANSPDAVRAYESMAAKVTFYAKALEDAKVKVDQLKQASGNTAEKDVSNKLLEEQRKDAKALAKEVSGKLADAILDGGKGGFKGLRDWVKDYFIRQPIKVLLQASLQSVGNMVAQMAYPGAGALGGGGGSGGGMNPFSMASSALSSSMAYSAMVPGLTSAGAGSQAAMLAAQTGEFGLAGLGMTAASGGSAVAGTMMSALGPLMSAAPYIAAAVMAISMLDSGGGGPKTEAGYTRNGLNIAGKDIGGNMQGSQRGDVGAAQKISEGISTSYEGLAKQLGLVNRKIDVGVFYSMDNAEGGTSMTQLQMTSSAGYNRSTRAGGIENVERGEEALKKELASEALRVLISALSSDEGLAPKFKEYLSKIDINADDSTLQKALDTVTAVKQLQDLLGGMGASFASLADLGIEATASFVEMNGGLQALTSSLGSYYSNFFSGEERRQQTARNIATTVNRVGGGLSADDVLRFTREEFRKFVEVQDLTTNSGREMYSALLSVNQAFADLHPEIDKTTSAADRAVEQASKKLDLERQIMELEGNTAALRALEMEGLDETNQLLQLRVYALQDEQAARIEAEEAIQKAADSAREAQERYASALAEAQNFLDGFTRNIQQYLDRLNATEAGGGSAESQLEAARTQFERQLTLARSGDRDALGGITGYADQLIEANRRYSASGGGTPEAIRYIQEALGQLPSQLSAEQLIVNAVAAGATTVSTAVSTGAALTGQALEQMKGIIAGRLDSGFALIDTSLDGKITTAEFLAGLRGVATEGTLLETFRSIDTNGDGVITRLESVNANLLALQTGLLSKLDAGFATFDLSADGLLNQSEFLGGLEGLASDEVLTTWFARLDANGDGQVSRLEAINASIASMQGAMVERLSADFTKLDTTLDGLLSYPELQAGLGASFGASDAVMRELFTRLDLNGDGQLTKLELIAASAASTAADTSNGVVPILGRLSGGMHNDLMDVKGMLHYDLGVISGQLAGVLNVRSETRSAAYPTYFADGGAFTNGIVSRPTQFNIGEMGEGGRSEAIVPLAMMPNGSLGVSGVGFGGSGGTDVVVAAAVLEFKRSNEQLLQRLLEVSAEIGMKSLNGQAEIIQNGKENLAAKRLAGFKVASKEVSL